MVDPIISTGLAKDWLERLLKSWSTLRKTREGELQEIRNVFGDPELLADYYIEPDCQPVNPADHDEDEAIRAFRQPVRFWLNRFLEGEFFERDGRNTVFVLSDAGMGKTSLLMMLKLTHLSRFWPDGLDFRLMKLGPDTLENLAKIQNHAKTVLLLDSLDEDPSAWGRIEERLMELLDATKSFRQVVLTCRTQFFPEGSAAPIEAPYKVVVPGGYICNLLYLSPFDNAQVEAYLQNVYPNRWRDLLRKWWKKEDNPNLVRARKAVEPMKSLRLRPMLLAHIEELLQADLQQLGEFPVYAALVRHWLMREQRKQRGKYTEAQLWEVCEEVAVFLQVSGKRVLSLEDLEAIRRMLPAAETLEAFDIGGRSLLNRTSDKGFRFSHYSIQEFLVAHRLVAGRWRESAIPTRATDQLLSFIFSWIEQSCDRIASINWLSLDLSETRFKVDQDYQFSEAFAGSKLRGAYLRGARISGCLRSADLRDAWLEDSILNELNLERADLRRAHLKGSKLAGSDLRLADLRRADLSICSLVKNDLSFGRFAGANFQGVDYRDNVSTGAGFLAAEGFSSLLIDETAGPPIPRMLTPRLLIEEDKGKEVPASCGVVKISAGRELASILARPRILAWLSRKGLLSLSSGEMSLWSSGKRISGKRSTEVRSLAWAPDEDSFLVLDREYNLERWSLQDLRCLAAQPGFGSAQWAVGYYGDDIFVASEGNVPTIYRIGLDLESRERIISLEGVWGSCLAWKAGKPVLAVVDEEKVWAVDLKRGKEERLGDSPGSCSLLLAWAPSGRWLAGIERGAILCIWQTREGGDKFRFRIAQRPVTMLAWAPGEKRIALLSRSGTVTLLDVSTLITVELPVRASSLAWYPQGEFLAVAAQNGAIEIWDASGDVPQLLLSLFETLPVDGLVITADGYVDGPHEALQYVRFADGLALYDLEDLPERHDPERVRQAMAILGP